MAEKRMNLFFTCVDWLTVGSKLQLQGHNNEWSMDLDSQVPCRTSCRTRTWHQASGWRNKLFTRIILCAHLQMIFRHPYDPSSLICVPCACLPRTRKEKINYCKKQLYWCINQGSDGNWKKNGSPKWTNIYNNTGAPFIIYTIGCYMKKSASL